MWNSLPESVVNVPSVDSLTLYGTDLFFAGRKIIQLNSTVSLAYINTNVAFVSQKYNKYKK